MPHRWAGRIALALSGVLTTLAVTTAPAAAAPGDPFTCRASLIRTSGFPVAPLNQEPVVANNQNNPCRTETKNIFDFLTPGIDPLGDDNTLELAGGAVTAKLLFAETVARERRADAESGVLQLRIAIPGVAPVVRANVLTANAAAACGQGKEAPTLTSGSTIAQLFIDNAAPVPNEPLAPVTNELNRPRVIELPGGVAVRLNQEYRTASATGGPTDTITRRALEVNTPVGNVVVAEAIADFRGNPCDRGGNEICGNGIDDNGNGQIDEGCPNGEEICGNGIDDDGDGRIDEGCNGGQEEVCGNGVDDNGNGQIDEGCPPGGGGQEICGNGVDDNGNGQIDEGCGGGGSGTDPNDPPECSDERDNDGDGFTDYPNDPGCESYQDDSERDNVEEPECSNGQDDDGDGQVDYPEDPGCVDRDDDDERNPSNPECSDGADNDRDGTTDSGDSGCKSPSDDDEAAGFITGGGGHDEVDRRTRNEDIVSPGTFLRYGTVLPCDLGDTPGPNQTVTWHDPGLQGRWKLTTLTRAYCRNDPDINPGNPFAEFDTYVGEGSGTFRNALGVEVPIQARFHVIDRGEPGAPPVIGVDVFHIRIPPNVALPSLATGTGTLDHGNNQAHSPRGKTGRSK